MQEMTVYSRAGYRVVTLIAGYVVRGENGAVLDRYPATEIEGAIEAVDHMAGLGPRESASVSM